MLKNKSFIYSIVLLLVFLGIYVKEKFEAENNHPYVIEGTTMGRIPYRVKYSTTKGLDFSKEIDELLIDFNKGLSTYDPTSEISTFNQGLSFTFQKPYFLPVLKKAQEVYSATDGAFDPTVYPLVNAWGFGPGIADSVIQQPVIDSLLSLVGYDKISFDEKHVAKNSAEVGIDFSAIAKGYAVDLVGELLENKGVENYLVEIGGEVRARGVNRKGIPWVLGVTNPKYKTAGEDPLSEKVSLNNLSLATSGNYENYYVKGGKKYAHTISPTTGYPVQHSLLSASVIAEDCMTADAYATAFMVMGKEQVMKFLESHPELAVLLIYDEEGVLKKEQNEAFTKLIPHE